MAHNLLLGIELNKAIFTSGKLYFIFPIPNNSLSKTLMDYNVYL